MTKRGFNKKSLLILLILFILIICVDFFTEDETYIDDQNYIKELNIDLKGKIQDIYKLKYGHNYGIITVDISESSVKKLDERKNRKRFLGFIKNKFGYFVLGTISDFQIGDSIVIKSNLYNLYRSNQEVVRDKNIILPPKDVVFRPYKEINKRLRYINTTK